VSGSGAVSGLNLPLMAARTCCPLYSLYSALCSLQLTRVAVIKARLPNADNFTKFGARLKTRKWKTWHGRICRVENAGVSVSDQ